MAGRFSMFTSVNCKWLDADDRGCQALDQAVAVGARELERAGGVLLGLEAVAAGCERLRPAEMRAGRPQPEAVVGVDAARECKLLVGLVVVPHRRGCHTEPQAHMAVAESAAPDELVLPRRHQLVNERGGLGCLQTRR